MTHDARVAGYAGREVIVRDGTVSSLTAAALSSGPGTVIRLGLRLAVSGGREAVTRLVIIAAAVGIGAGLLLTAVSAVNAVGVQTGRYAWLDTGAQKYSPQRDAAASRTLCGG